MEIELAVSQAAEKHGYLPLKDEQRTFIELVLQPQPMQIVALSGVAAIMTTVNIILMTNNDMT